MATTVRRLVAFLGLELDDKSFRKADGALTSLKKGAGLLAAAFGAREIARGFAAIINLASDAGETTSQLEALFGESAEQIAKDADQMAKDLGRSTFDIQKSIATIGAIAKPLLGSSEAAREVGTEFARLSIDLASFFNATEDDALLALRSGLTGETEPLKRFGVDLSVAALQAFSLSRGVSKSVTTMTAAEKAQLRFALIMERTVDAQGDAIRTASGFANVSRAVISLVKDLATRFGKFFLPAIEKSSAAVRDLLISVQKWVIANEALLGANIEVFMKVISELLEATARTVVLVANGWRLLANGAFDLVRSLSPLEDSLDTILIIGAALVGVFGLLPLLMFAFIAALILVADDLQGFREGRNSLIGQFLESPINPEDHWLVQIFQNVVKWVATAFKDVNVFLEGLAEDVVKLGTSEALLQLFTTAIAFWTEQFEEFGKFLGEFFSLNIPGFDSLIDFIAGVDRSGGGQDFLTEGAKAQLAFIRKQGGTLGKRRIVGTANAAAAAGAPLQGGGVSQDLTVNQVINAAPGMNEAALADVAAERVRRIAEGQRRIAERQMSLRNNRGARR